ETGVMDANKGLRGNANYGGRRQVTIISAERWAELGRTLAAAIDPAVRRANLLVSGVDLVETRGRILRIGVCRVAIGGETRPCERMDEAHRGLQEAMRVRWGGGVWAEVLDDGEIRAGDVVAWEG